MGKFKEYLEDEGGASAPPGTVNADVGKPDGGKPPKAKPVDRSFKDLFPDLAAEMFKGVRTVKK